jgi:peptide/nickel transport system permease protein
VPAVVASLFQRTRLVSLRAPIAKFIAKRALFGVVTLFIVSVLVFVLLHALRGDAASIVLGRDATPETLASLRSQHGLDRPLLAQFGSWIGGVVRGDLGTTYTNNQPVWQLLGARVTASMFLLLCAGLVSIPLAIAFGSLAALKRDRPFDSASGIITLILASLPEFVVGSLLIVLLATNVTHTLPSTRYLSPGNAPWTDMKGMILPVLTLVIAVVPYVARVTRAAVVEVLESDYVEMARLKGMPERTVLVRHALPNAIGPIFQVVALNLAYLAGGVIVIEWLFNYPGIGSALNEAVRSRDLPVVQFLALVIAGVYIITNLLADIGTVLATPRLRTKLT